MNRGSNNTRQHPSKKAIAYAFLAVVLWWFVIFSGSRLPYLHTEFAFKLRAYVLFPLLLGLLTYFAFVFKKKGFSSSGYRMAMDSFSERKTRIKGTLFGIFGLILIPAFFAWTSIAFPAWITEFAAKREYARQYVIERVEVRGGPVWSTVYHLHLQGQNAGEGVTLPLTKVIYEQAHWKSGQSICARGRSWILGTIIDEVGPGAESCITR